jgi:hypothetical protein
MARFDVDSEWRAAWRAAGFRRRRRILRALGRGLALEDPGDATLAVGIIRFRNKYWYLPWIQLAAVLTVAWAAATYVGRWTSTAIVVVYSALVWLSVPSSTRSYKGRLALERNEAVVDGFNAFAVNNATFEEIAAWRETRS